MSTEYHNHTEGEIKHQRTRKHFLKKLFLSSFDYLSEVLGKVSGARGMPSDSKLLGWFLVVGSGKQFWNDLWCTIRLGKWVKVLSGGRVLTAEQGKHKYEMGEQKKVCGIEVEWRYRYVCRHMCTWICVCKFVCV